MTGPVLAMRGVAEELAAKGVALYSLTAYPAGEQPLPCVFFGRLPTAPVLAVAVAHYVTDVTEDSYNPDLRIQLRWRAKTVLAVEAAADAGFHALHFFERTDTARTYPNGLHVQHCERISTFPAEVDANSNWERADSYLLTLNP